LYVNIRHLSLETYVTLSTEIVLGTVRWQLASVLPSGLVVTDYGISIQECLKGSLNDEVVLRLYGGVVDQYQTVVDRAAHLGLNSELVLFLCPGTEPSKRGILGLADGAYQVVASPTGERVVSGLHAFGVPLPVFASDIGSIVRKERK